MVMPMEGLAHTQATRQFIDSVKPVRVRTGCLMRHQDIGTLGNQTKVVFRKDGTAMLTR